MMKASPQTGGKEVETRPLEEKGSEEITDTVKRVKEILQMSKPPKHYIARQEKKAESHAEQETLDESDWAERIIAEEEQRFATEMMAAMNGSLHTDFQEMAKEVTKDEQNMKRITFTLCFTFISLCTMAQGTHQKRLQGNPKIDSLINEVKALGGNPRVTCYFDGKFHKTVDIICDLMKDYQPTPPTGNPKMDASIRKLTSLAN